MRTILLLAMQAACFSLFAQPVTDNGKWRPLVNQAGYNLGESKRFVCYGAPDGAGFRILNHTSGKEMFRGEVLNFEGWFTEFNPQNFNGEYVVEVDGHGRSVPFEI